MQKQGTAAAMICNATVEGIKRKGRQRELDRQQKRNVSKTTQELKMLRFIQEN